MDCHVEIKRSGEMEQISAINEARYAIIHGTDEEVIITDSKPGEVLFHYDRHVIKWMDGDFARALFL